MDWGSERSSRVGTSVASVPRSGPTPQTMLSYARREARDTMGIPPIAFSFFLRSGAELQAAAAKPPARALARALPLGRRTSEGFSPSEDGQ